MISLVEYFFVAFFSLIGLTITMQSILHKMHFYQKTGWCEFCLGFWVQMIIMGVIFFGVLIKEGFCFELLGLLVMPYLTAGVANRF